MNPILALRLIAAIGCVVMAGVYFAFSVGVMPGLARLEPKSGMIAMQAINRSILNPLFLGVFVGSAVLGVLMVLFALRDWPDSSAVRMVISGILFVVGSFVVTIFFNVPLNNALMTASTDGAAGLTLWGKYLTEWTAWNHLRAATSLVAAFIMLI
jgi:uncharacterized membrane protein